MQTDLYAVLPPISLHYISKKYNTITMYFRLVSCI